jgi:hypothetical protein
VNLPRALLTLFGLPLSFNTPLLGLALAYDAALVHVAAEQFERVRDRQLRVGVARIA